MSCPELDADGDDDWPRESGGGERFSLNLDFLLREDCSKRGGEGERLRRCFLFGDEGGEPL